MGGKHVSVGGALLVDGKAGAARQVQGIHGYRFHGIQDHHIVKRDIRPLGNPPHFIHVLRIPLLCKRQIFPGLDLCPIPG